MVLQTQLMEILLSILYFQSLGLDQSYLPAWSQAKRTEFSNWLELSTGLDIYSVLNPTGNII